MLEKALNTVMPFKIIRFGNKNRKGRYTLSHKNSFLVRVQLLDNTVMECTLTVENTGIDCLNAVANRLDLKEVQYFGLQYFNKQMAIRWVELDKPLKKQVDKNAQDTTLFFRVMYYVANFELLQQEITRYLFYLQLKNNVIDGCLPRSPEEAIELASYMLQAEFGDYNPSVHTVQYFRDYILFPEVMAPNEEILDSLTRETLNLHERHRGLTPPDAEFNYILKVIHLDGYGEECYMAKDLQSCDYEIGCSFFGIVTRKILPPAESQGDKENNVSQYSVGTVTWYEWSTIDHVLFNKAVIILNMRKDDTTLQFHMEDGDTAKYVCRMFEMRRKFYSLNRQLHKKLAVENGEVSIQRRPTLRRTQDTPIPIAEVGNSTSTIDQHAADAAQMQPADYISSQENLHSYTRQPDAQYYTSQTSLDHVYVSQTSLNRAPGIQQEYGYANGYVPGGSMYSSPSINSLGQSQTQLNQRSPASSNMSLSSERHIASNGVPVYRCTPDYEQAVQQRRRYSSYLENQAVATRQKQPDLAEVHDGSLKPRPHSMIYSQQELLHQAIHGPHYAHYPPQNPPLHYPLGNPQRVDSASHLPSSQTQLHRQFESSHESLPPVHGLMSRPGQYPVDVNQQMLKDRRVPTAGGVPVPGNAILAASTPELANSMQQVKGYSGSEMQILRHYTKPPPPYPRNNSTSTPDLSAHRQTGVSASTPDLHQGFSVAPGQRRTQLHPVLIEDGGYPMQEQQNDFQPTVIRGVCTSVEGLHHPQQNVHPQNQRPQAAAQSVHAYLQELSIEQSDVQGALPRSRTRHTGQQHHRPMSYPPRLNHSNQILSGVEEDLSRLPPVHQPHTPLERSQTNSSTSTVGSSYGSQQFIPQQHGSQISLQHAQLAPATHPVLTQYLPTPQRAEVHITGSSGNLQYQRQPPQMHSSSGHIADDANPDEEDDVMSLRQQIASRDAHPTPQHMQMASNVTMVVHSSASEKSSDSDDDYSSEDDEPKADYRSAPLTTIDDWHRSKPTAMYVPPKPKPDAAQYVAAGPVQDLRPPPPYPQGSSVESSEEMSHSIPKIPLINTSDHDPPKSYRKPDQMESFDEGDVARVSVFPHPNPSAMPHSPKLSNTNPFYSSNPFYSPNDDITNAGTENVQNIFDFQPNNGLEEQEEDSDHLFANAPSGGLRNARRSTRKNSPLKLSATSIDIDELPSPSTGTPDDRVLQLEKKVEDGKVLTEFEKIPKTRISGEPSSGDPNGRRDRIKSILPYPEFRVKTSPTADNPEGYINASLLKVDVAEQEWRYILCQNPLNDFMHEFWDMVWEQRISIITMISREVEDGKNRCGRYWPEQAGDSNGLLFGNYRVASEIISDFSQTAVYREGEGSDEDSQIPRSRVGSTACENLTTSILVLQKAGTTECRKIWHLQYYGWPDSGAPKDATDFLAFLEELESVRRLAHDLLPQNDAPPPPVLVHCASGSGRSGVLVLCDLMRHSLEHNKTTTVPEMLKTLRQQRTHIVQTVSQYNFVYEVLILFLKNSRLI